MNCPVVAIILIFTIHESRIVECSQFFQHILFHSVACCQVSCSTSTPPYCSRFHKRGSWSLCSHLNSSMSMVTTAASCFLCEWHIKLSSWFRRKASLYILLPLAQLCAGILTKDQVILTRMVPKDLCSKAKDSNHSEGMTHKHFINSSFTDFTNLFIWGSCSPFIVSRIYLCTITAVPQNPRGIC